MAGEGRAAELAREQAFLTAAYQRLDQLRARAARRLREVRAAGASGTPQARSERDAFAGMYAEQVARYEAAEVSLYFGRIDRADGERHRIGRIGLSDESGETMLVDWRAPAAEPFYRATPRHPHGLVRRRQVRTRVREVVDVADDVFDVAALTDADRATLGGEAALLAALAAPRTGRMHDIVATIQAEQDAVIRAEAPAGGVLVVAGGPGTGKTVVALHRAAYLLYHDRSRLARSGVLVLGPNEGYLRYIDAVLPALGETSVLLRTLDRMLPGVAATGDEPEQVAALKGDPRMVEVIAAAVAAWQRLPDAEVSIAFEADELVLTPAMVAAARAHARRSRRPHNRARYAFARRLLRDLLVQREPGADAGADTGARRWAARALAAEPDFRDAVNQWWPRVWPEQLLRELFASPAALAAAAPGLSRAERAALVRPPHAPWTPADVPLLDEAAALLGDPDEMLKVAAARRARAGEEEYARAVLAATGLAGRVDARTLADRFADPGAGRETAVEQAAADPGWQFGHVVVDEAQELSAMAWRMVARRCRAGGLTVVGDVAQTSAPWGARSWDEVRERIGARSWQVRTLSVNYRTPAEVMAVAAGVLAVVDPAARPLVSVRSTGTVPAAWPASAPGELPATVADAVAGELADLAEGTVGVLVPPAWHAPVRDALGAAGPRVSVLTPAAAKGLEFDVAVVVEPAAIVAGSPRGWQELYVCLSRTTARLLVVHAAALPGPLARLPVAAATGAGY